MASGMPSGKAPKTGVSKEQSPEEDMLSERDLIKLFNKMNLGPRAIMRLMLVLEDGMQPEPESEPEPEPEPDSEDDLDMFGRPMPPSKPSWRGSLSDDATGKKIYAWSRVLAAATEQGIGSKTEWTGGWYAVGDFWSFPSSKVGRTYADLTAEDFIYRPRSNENKRGAMSGGGGDGVDPPPATSSNELIYGPSELMFGKNLSVPAITSSSDLAETAPVAGLRTGVGEGEGDSHDDNAKSQSVRREGHKTSSVDAIVGVNHAGSAGMGVFGSDSGLKRALPETPSTAAKGANSGRRKPMPPPKRRKLTAMELCFPKSLQQKNRF